MLLVVSSCGDDVLHTSASSASEETSESVSEGSTTSSPSTGSTGTVSASESSSATAGTTGTTAGTTAGTTTGTTTGGPLTCVPYPLLLPADPGAQQVAADALAMLAPGAVMMWSPERGTAKAISGLDAPFACADGDESMPQVWDLVQAHPDIFQIDASEWGPGGSLPCKVIKDKDRIVTITRATLGEQPVFRDTIAFRLRRIDGEVKLRGIVGTYLPETTPELTSTMAGCADLDFDAAIQNLQQTPLPYTVFEFCIAQDLGNYTPLPSDNFEFDADPKWLWAEDIGKGQVVLTKLWDGRVIVAPENYSDPLLSSDAACPEEVGFRVTFDSVLGDFIGSMPGIKCLVC